MALESLRRSAAEPRGPAAGLMRDDGGVDNGAGEPDAELPGTPEKPHNGRQRWVWGALFAQSFLITAYIAVLTSGRPPAVVAMCTLALLAFSAVYVLLVGRLARASLIRRIGIVLILLALSLPLFAILGPDASSLWIFVAVAGGLLFQARAAAGVGLALAAAMLAVQALGGVDPNWELALTLVAMTAFMIGFANNIKLNAELRCAQEQLALAAVAAERERIGRDLHDILGHSLTAIAVKAGLARRLLGRDNAAAATEIADVERLAREALTDVRATASGYREVSLGTELAVASTVLRAAGVTPILPQAIDDVDPAARVLFGYVVREAVTNVVRHSNARTCTVTLGRRTIEVTDDGTGVGPDATGPSEPARSLGTGLPGLAARIAAAGGTVQAGPRRGGGFVVRAGLPDKVAPPTAQVLPQIPAAPAAPLAHAVEEPGD